MKHKRITIFGRTTACCLEDVFWTLIDEIREETGESLNQFVERMFINKPPGRSLASAIRVAVAKHFHPYPDQYREMQVWGRLVPARNGGVHLMTWPTRTLKTPKAA
jgi:predicted DNA-binding ribbon-helix-helix protein